MTPGMLLAKSAIVASALEAALVILAIGFGFNPIFNIILLVVALGVYFAGLQMMKRGR